ncbi:transposase [candidate division KSB1 bacterium]|nr:transposase [candidate division KSB1 bacterium]
MLATYEGGVSSAYHPKMLLRVLIYAYISKIYTSRGIAKALRQDIHLFMAKYPPTFQNPIFKELFEQPQPV